jgi:hypothetical protein
MVARCVAELVTLELIVYKPTDAVDSRATWWAMSGTAIAITRV